MVPKGVGIPVAETANCLPCILLLSELWVCWKSCCGTLVQTCSALWDTPILTTGGSGRAPVHGPE